MNREKEIQNRNIKVENKENKEKDKNKENKENKENLNTGNRLQSNNEKKKKLIGQEVAPLDNKKNKSLVKKNSLPCIRSEGNTANAVVKVADEPLALAENTSINISILSAVSINDRSVYLERENALLLKHYGAEVYIYTRELETESVNKNFLKRHQINPEIRTKMIDWMIEVLSVYKSEAETFFLAVSIMDQYIDKAPCLLRSESVHLIGMTSMFIASKFEDVIPVRMNSMVAKIGHNLFSE
jgi:hypothetical protein